MIFIFSNRFAWAIVSFIGLIFPSSAALADNSSKAETNVPSVTYRSVFRETSLGVEQEKLDWRKANDDVGKFTRGHVDILKQEEMDGKAMDKKAMDTKAMPTKTAPAPHKH